MPFKNRRKSWPKEQEERVAEELTGRRVPASGSMRHNKGDVVTQTFLIDAKQTKRGSYAISHKILSKLCAEAVGRRKKPALHLELEGAAPGQDQWVVLRWDDFLALIDGD